MLRVRFSSMRGSKNLVWLLQKGLLDAGQVDIVETLTNPTSTIPGYDIRGLLGLNLVGSQSWHDVPICALVPSSETIGQRFDGILPRLP